MTSSHYLFLGGHEWEAALGPHDMPDPNPLSQVAQSNLWWFTSVWFCVASRGGTEPSRPIEAAAAIIEGRFRFAIVAQ